MCAQKTGWGAKAAQKALKTVSIGPPEEGEGGKMNNTDKGEKDDEPGRTNELWA